MTTKPCPTCGGTMTLNTANGFYVCANCGRRLPETLDEAAARLRASQPQQAADVIRFRGNLHPRALSLFESAREYARRGQNADALNYLHDVVELQPDFTDAHVWIARLSPDEAIKREHLSEALARDPGNLDAIRMLMILNGDLTPEEAARTYRADDPERRAVDAPVRVKANALRCPVCGGDLTVDEATNRVVCRFCGYTATIETPRGESKGNVLGAALLKRRAQAVKWVIGERLLHCTQCGAERTIPAQRMSQRCPFCGSNHVIIEDALKTFEKPEQLIPFRVGEDEAKAAIRDKLDDLSERIAGLFGDNRVAQASIEGLFVPFWVFDALVEVSQTTTDNRTPSNSPQARRIQPYQNIRFQDGMTGVQIAGAKSLPAPLVDAIGGFDLSQATAYDPRLLARYPAALYDVDFDAASLDARSHITRVMRERYERKSGELTVTAFASVTQMTFTLVLMPLWIATLYERDGDVRTALVNGQTGRAALGRARKNSD